MWEEQRGRGGSSAVLASARLWLLAFGLALALPPFPCDAVELAQESGNRFTLQADPLRPLTNFHKNIAGKRCLQFEGLSRQKITDSSSYEHVVGVENICLERIKVSLCYLGSEQCIDIDVPGLQYKEVIMDFNSKQRFFAYRYVENN